MVCGHDEKNPNCAVVRIVEKSGSGVSVDTRVLGVQPESGDLGVASDLNTTYIPPLDADEDMEELSDLVAG